MKQLNTFFLRYQFLASQSQSLWFDLCLIDPPVKRFDGESLLHALLYGSDEFNDKINKCFSVLFQTGVTTLGWKRWEPVPLPSTFYVVKMKKNEEQRKIRKSFKAETVKRLSPRSKHYFLENVDHFILEYLEFKYVSVFHGPFTLKSIPLALPNLALICAALDRKLISLRCVLGCIFSYVFSLLVMNQLFSSFFFYLFETCKC